MSDPFTQPNVATMQAISCQLRRLGNTRRGECAIASVVSLTLTGVLGFPRSLTAATISPNPALSWPAEVFSPYVDVSVYPTPQLGVMSAASGTKYYTLAFLDADTSNSTIPSWGGYDSYPVAATSATNQSTDFGYNLITGINAVRAAGGDVMASFGGADGTPIDSTITNVTALVAQYQNVINTYHLNAIDFDVEGSWDNDSASISRRSAAAALLQQANPGLKVWLTLPVALNGLTSSGLAVVNSALNAGVKLSGVNILAMDYGSANSQMGNAAITAATDTHNQLKTAFAAAGDSYTDAQIWAMQGITPMIGVNDTTSETFTYANAQQVLTFAQQKGIGYLSMWSATRDFSGTLPVNSANSSISQTPYQFAKLLSQYTGAEPANTQWISSAGGSWGILSNWSAGLPDAPAAVATLANLSASAVVTIDTGRTVGQLVLNNPSPITVTGGSLTINNTGATSTPGISILQGNQTIASPIALVAGATISLAANSSLNASGTISGTGGLSVTGTGGLTLSNVETYSGATLISSAAVTLPAGARLPPGSAVVVSNGGQVLQSKAYGSPLSVVTLASISTDATSRFDITGNDLVLTATTLAATTSAVATGYEGNWASGGLVSSWAASDTTHLTTLGVIQNNQSGVALYSSGNPFDGASPNPGDVLVKLTYCGDANLDGKVDGSDYSLIDNGALNHLTGWYNGDFNYDGVINGSDYTLIDNSFNTQGSPLSSAALIASTLAEIAPVIPASSQVPEPSPGIIAVAFLSLLGPIGRRGHRVKPL